MPARSLRTAIVSSVVCVSMYCSTTCKAQYATFDADTDTISLQGNTILETQFTIEAVIRLASSSANALIWNEWQNFAEDKQFGILHPNPGVYGFANLGGGSVIAGGTAVIGQWTHFAYVYDGAQERIYIGGLLVGSRAASANVPDGVASRMVVGAIVRNSNNVLYPSFRGDIDSLRVSSVSRYSGSQFSPPAGDLSNEPGTLLLLNFNQLQGTTTVVDESGSGIVGTLGVGFSGATTPTFARILCEADFNVDGVVDFFDYLDFVAAFSEIEPTADFNGDTEIDFFDYLDFVAAFSSPC